MKFAVCNEIFGDLGWSTVCERVAGYGYQGLEIAPFTLGDDPVSLPFQERNRFRAIATSHGLEVVGLHWLLAKTSGLHLTSPEAGVRRRTATYLQQLTELCADLGGQVMVFGSPQQRSYSFPETPLEAAARAREVIDQVLPTLEQHRVILALEPLGIQETNFWTHADEVISFLDDLNSPWVRLHLDVKAMASESRAIADTIRRSRQHVVHVHANDPNQLGPGMGFVEYGSIFQALQDIRYEGWLSVEVFDYTLGADYLAEESLRYLQRQLADRAPAPFGNDRSLP